MNRLKELRIKKNIKQQDLAKALNVTKQSVSNWENGKRLPNIEILILLADFYNCSLDYLVGRELKEDNL
ncbi:MAG: helix-turn-helix transcriptional regulator [Bacilli bacterium]|nr:helix-turn-helix transcriptional regulator [Bacilli bacterium]